MSNKRNLKSAINSICKSLAAEAMAASLDSHSQNNEDVDAILTSIIILNNDYIRRITHPEPGIEQIKYFKDVINSFKKHITEIVDQINSLN